MQASDKKITNMLRRRTTGIVLAILLVGLWIVQGWPLRIGFVALMVVGMWEVYSAFKIHGDKPIVWPGMVYAILSMPLYRLYGVSIFTPLMALCSMLGLAGVILRGEVDFGSAVATLFPMIYPGILISMLYPLQDLSVPLHATLALGLSFLIAEMNDLFAYEVGSLFGKHPMAPVLSPKKTIEGSIGGMTASVVFATLIPIIATLITTYVPMAQPYAAPLPPWWHFALLGLVGGVSAQVGDLTASMIKRHCGIKDFGSIFPGHGGMLDRMDSVLFTGVVVYMYFVLVAHL